MDEAIDSSIAIHKNFSIVHARTIKKQGFKFKRWLELAFYQLSLHGLTKK